MFQFLLAEVTLFISLSIPLIKLWCKSRIKTLLLLTQRQKLKHKIIKAVKHRCDVFRPISFKTTLNFNRRIKLICLCDSTSCKNVILTVVGPFPRTGGTLRLSLDEHFCVMMTTLYFTVIWWDTMRLILYFVI